MAPPPIPENLEDLAGKELATLLTGHKLAVPRLIADRVTALKKQRLALEKPPETKQKTTETDSDPTLHVYSTKSALANTVAKYYGLSDLAKLPAPRWTQEMLMSPAAWVLLIQHHKYRKGDFGDLPERLAPGLQPFRLGVQSVFPAVMQEPSTLRSLEVIFRSIAVEYLALDAAPTVHHIHDLVFKDMRDHVALATALIHQLYIREAGVPAAAQAVLIASQALQLTALPAHLASTGQAMLRAVEKTAVADAAAPAKRAREEDTQPITQPVRFYCKRCAGWFVDQPGKTPHAATEAHKKKL